MIRTATQPDVFAIASKTSANLRQRSLSAAQARSEARRRDSEEQRHWMEDVTSFIVVCMLAATSLTICIWLFREFARSMMQYNSLEILRGFSGM